MDTLQTELKPWLGRIEQHTDVLTAASQQGLWALLDRDGPAPTSGGLILPLSHWMYFSVAPRQSDVGEDGHPQRGGFLPPVTLPRRMWASSEVEFHRALHVDDEAQRLSRIDSIDARAGRSGPLVFVTVRHEISDRAGLALTELQHIVYRGAPASGAKDPDFEVAPENSEFKRLVRPDPVMLFRYSALTRNGHRIHYDQPYATQVEGYPGLVVHGPLLATLLIDLACRELPARAVRRFSFRALSPLFDTHPFSICGRREDGRTLVLWARGHDGRLAMRATAEFH